MRYRVLILLVLATALTGSALAQQNHIDLVTPAAPELAAYGTYDIGVRTLQVTDKNRPDILTTKEGGPVARYDRTLTLEVWYPATPAHRGQNDRQRRGRSHYFGQSRLFLQPVDDRRQCVV